MMIVDALLRFNNTEASDWVPRGLMDVDECKRRSMRISIKRMKTADWSLC